MPENDSDIIDVQTSDTTSAAGAVTRRRRVRVPIVVALACLSLALGGGAATGINRLGADEERRSVAEQLHAMQQSIDDAKTESAAARAEVTELRAKYEAQSRQLDRIERQFDSLNDFLRKR